jgi:hypothetical protein
MHNFFSTTLCYVCGINTQRLIVGFISVASLITWGGEVRGRGTKLTMGIRNFILQRVKFESVENWPDETQVFHFLFSVYFLFTIIEFSNQINYS